MKFSTGRKVAVLLAGLALMCLATDRVLTAPPPPLPNPVLVFTGQEPYQEGGKSWVRYKYAVDNSAAYPHVMFAPTTHLPPCCKNARSSSTWVALYVSPGT